MTNQDASLATWPQVLMHTYPTPSVCVASGAGATLMDTEGRQYVDMLSGIAVNSLGYGHPAVVAAVTEQVQRFAHVSNLLGSRPAVAVAQKLIERFAAGNDELARGCRVYFGNSGAEANEAAFKLARLTGRRRILAAEHGFHGRTMGSLALTGQPEKREPFAPLPAGVEFFPYGDAEALERLVAQDPEDTAAIILEPIQGETGIVPPPEGYLAAVRRLCDRYGILFICDEVQTGVGRTGDFFAFQHEGITPDVVTMAKGLGAGLPIGACLACGPAAELFTVGAHGTTFGGNPVACAAAEAVLDTIDDAFLAEVREKGASLAARLAELPQVDHVRGRGLMLGVVLTAPVAKQAVEQGIDRGIILNAPQPTVIRLVPPLVIDEHELDTAVSAIADLLTALVPEPTTTED